MDDIQTWIYVIVGLIYFIVRAVKKNKPIPPNTSDQDSQNPQRADSERRKPLTFEELLKEFTDPQSTQSREEEVEEIEDVKEEERERTKEDFAQEGSVRRFSDEESRRVYEESIKKAEGFQLKYEADDDYHSEKLKNILHDHEDVEEDSTVDDVREMLSNPQDAKKAIILGEILGRRY